MFASKETTSLSRSVAIQKALDMRTAKYVILISALAVAAINSGAIASDLELIRRNRELLKTKLKDPDSAQFNIEKVIRNEGGLVVCGEFNAKNSFGGYTGYQRWIGLAPYIALIEKETKNFKSLWAKSCDEPKSSSKPKEHLPLAR
ncbi:hypothetical protein [Methylobacterium sp.]|uniref:hypothetical protein n=1 Tax=Methylobacterium sp. TaxID=409 RepID=UPI003B58D600